MPWLYLEGQFLELPKRPDWTNRESGEVNRGDWEAQILVKKTRRNGEADYEVVKFACHDPEVFRSFVGKRVRVPVEAYNRKSGATPGFSLPRDSVPEIA
jgi:hypothetical protein